MTHVPLTDYSELKDPRAKAVYDEIQADLGFGMVPNLFKSMAQSPALLAANWQRFRSVVLDGVLPRTLKEMIGVAISQHHNSQYALKVHLHGLSALGISEEVLRLLVSDFENCPLPAREKTVIRFGVLAGTRPQALTAAHFEELRARGLDELEIYEILSTANLFASVNQYTDAIDLEIDRL